MEGRGWEGCMHIIMDKTECAGQSTSLLPKMLVCMEPMQHVQGKGSWRRGQTEGHSYWFVQGMKVESVYMY